MVIAAFVLGFFLGGLSGIVAMALCAAASRRDSFDSRDPGPGK